MNNRAIIDSLRKVLNDNPNMISSFNGRRYFNFKIEPNDKTRRYYISNNVYYEIFNDLSAKYREHLISFKIDSFSFIPVFDDDTQKIWDRELADFINRKAEII